MEYFDFIKLGEAETLPEDPQIAFARFVEFAQPRLIKRLQELDGRDEDSWQLIQDAKYGFQDVVLGAAKKFGIEPFASSDMELRKNYNDDDYKQFRADLSLYITQIMLHAADADRSGTVPLLDENRQALRTKIYHLRKAIDNTDLPDWRKKRLHKRLDELEQELTRVRIRMSVVVAVALAIYGVPGEAVASYDAVIRVANGIMHLIDEAKEADHEQRKISHQEPVALLPPRQKQQPLIAESFDRSEMDDEIPF